MYKTERVKVFLISMSLSACVSTHLTTPKPSPVPGLITSCAPSESIDVSGYEGILCTFENTGSQSVGFQLTDARFNEPQTRLLQRDEAQSLAEALANQRQDEIHNRKMTSLAFAGIGLIGALAGSSPSVQAAGAVTASAAVGYDSGADLKDNYTIRQHGKIESYAYGDAILKRNILVPAGLHLRRGFLVKAPRTPSSIVLCFNSDKTCEEFPLKSDF